MWTQTQVRVATDVVASCAALGIARGSSLVPAHLASRPKSSICVFAEGLSLSQALPYTLLPKYPLSPPEYVLSLSAINPGCLSAAVLLWGSGLCLGAPTH